VEALLNTPARTVGRYAIYGEIAVGGMATVHYGRLLGPVGFARTVAIKRLHPQYARDPEFVSMFLDEARLAARIHHPNVCSTLDVVTTQGELLLVFEYLKGDTLARLMRTLRKVEEPIDPAIAVSIMVGALQGLHAAHEARNERGVELGIVHRDVSPHNILVGADGVSRVLDFGVAKAAGRFHTTREGKVKGKLPYMAPEQLRGQTVDRQSDVYGASVCLWEALTGRRLFVGENEGHLLELIMHSPVQRPSLYASAMPLALEDIVMRGLERDKTKRFATAKEMALALQRAVPPALASDVGEWVESVAEHTLVERAGHIALIESSDPDAPAFQDVASELARSGAHDVASVPREPTSGVASIEVPSSVSGSSQLSNISVAKDGQALDPSAHARKKRLVLTLGSIAGVAAIALFFIFYSGGQGARSSASAAPSPEVPPPSDTARAVAATEPPPPLPPITSTSEPPPVPPMAKASAPPRPIPVAKPSAPSSGGDDCKVPYTLGPNGERVYKRKCL
jgi:serine/threonine protein kinase